MATAPTTGRGAQVVVDPDSDAGKAMRGAYAGTFEENATRVREAMFAGEQATGYRPDGSTYTGDPAVDVIVAPPDAGEGAGDDLQAQLDAMQQQITELQTDVATLESDLTALTDINATQQTQIDALEARVTALETPTP